MNVYISAATTDEIEITVQEESIDWFPQHYVPAGEVPTKYWEFPIYGENREMLSVINATNWSPTISSIQDYPDPVSDGYDISFSVNWNDADNEGVKMFVCSTDSFSTTTISCTDNQWCANANDYDLTNPIECSYTTQTSDIGTHNYYVFACDDEVSCSVSAAGTFEVVDNNLPVISALTFQ